MPPVRHITTRFALLLAAAALLPLVLFGAWALATLQRSTRESVVAENLAVAVREADDIGRDMSGTVTLLNAVVADLQETGVTPEQQDRLLGNFTLRSRQFRALTLFDAAGVVVATTSSPGAPPPQLSFEAAQTIDGVALSAPRLDQDLTPVSRLSVPMTRNGSLAGTLVADASLEDVVRSVTSIRAGVSGRALLTDMNGRLLAHGDRSSEHLIAEGHVMSGHPLLAATGPTWRQYRNDHGTELLGVVARVPRLGWALVIEQPTTEAFAITGRIQRQLVVAALAATIAMLVAGMLLGRQFIAPVVTLQRATQALAAGDFRARVAVNGTDEFSRLATSFNTMADRLVKLQDDVKSQERQVMFGRVVAGLFHDLTHPIQNIANNARLTLRNDLDDEMRASIQKTIERELDTLRRFMDDVLNVARPRPVEKFPVDMNVVVAEVVDAMRIEWERSGVQVSGRYTPGAALIDGDRFALGRVYRNLLANAIQATPSGGQVSVTTTRAGDTIEVSIADTGTGIPAHRLAAIFDDFVTTRRRGLGLGLATSRRIVEQLGGSISVRSTVGVGTNFTLRFPGSVARDVEAAS